MGELGGDGGVVAPDAREPCAVQQRRKLGLVFTDGRGVSMFGATLEGTVGGDRDDLRR